MIQKDKERDTGHIVLYIHIMWYIRIYFNLLWQIRIFFSSDINRPYSLHHLHIRHRQMQSTNYHYAVWYDIYPNTGCFLIIILLQPFRCVRDVNVWCCIYLNIFDWIQLNLSGISVNTHSNKNKNLKCKGKYDSKQIKTSVIKWKEETFLWMQEWERKRIRSAINCSEQI